MPCGEVVSLLIRSLILCLTGRPSSCPPVKQLFRQMAHRSYCTPMDRTHRLSPSTATLCQHLVCFQRRFASIATGPKTPPHTHSPLANNKQAARQTALAKENANNGAPEGDDTGGSTEKKGDTTSAGGGGQRPLPSTRTPSGSRCWPRTLCQRRRGWWRC